MTFCVGLSAARQKLLIRCSIFLNLSLLLYLSLSAGWNLSWQKPAVPYGKDDYLYQSEPLKTSDQDKTQNDLSSNRQTSSLRTASLSQDLATASRAKAQDLATALGARALPLDPLTSSKDIDDPTRYWLSQNASCYDKENTYRQALRGKFWVFYNYIRPSKKFSCNETITYTTHGDFTFLDNLAPLLERWMGPISVAVYAPGSDFEHAIDVILYYRDCASDNLVKDFATFHIFLDLDHISKNIPKHDVLLKKRSSCDLPEGLYPSYVSYKKSSSLDYPVNVARNIARESAVTHFIFPSDIELYPSPDLIPQFLQMVRRNDAMLRRPNPKVFVNSIFEISANHSLPNNKNELVQLLKNKIVIPFHKQVCSQCHSIPHSKEWLLAPVKEGLHVIHVGKRVKPYHHWEPIYISNNKEPMYDERLTWEGRSDKMAQGYKMCLQNYEFHILDNAFLIHRPGIKTRKELKDKVRQKKTAAQNSLLRKKIAPQIKKLYGVRKGCEMF